MTHGVASRRERDAAKREAAKSAPVLKKPTPEEQKAQQAAQQQTQQRAQLQEYHFRRQLDIRKVEALEAIAEALFVRDEERIVAWRKVQEDKQVAQMEEQKRLQAEAIAKAQAMTDAHVHHVPDPANLSADIDAEAVQEGQNQPSTAKASATTVVEAPPAV